MVIPSIKRKFQTGDYVPLKTHLGRIIECKILDDEWKLNPFDENSDTVIMYDSRALIYFLDWLEFRRNNRFDNIIIDSGWERTGKSMCSIAEKMIYDSPYYRNEELFNMVTSKNNWDILDFVKGQKLKLNQVCFDLNDYHTEISNCKENQGDFTILDEAGFRLFALEWWSQNQVNLIKEFQVIGKRRLITVLNVPHKDDLNNRIRDRRVTAWQYIFTRTDGPTVSRGYVEIRNANPDKWQLQVYWNPFLICRFPNLEDSVKEEWARYEKKKDIFIEEIIQEQVETLNTIDGQLSKRERKYFNDSCICINKMMEGYNGKDGYSMTEVARLIGIPISTLSTRLVRYARAQEKELEFALLLKDKEAKRARLAEVEAENMNVKGENIG